jgi:hypothetical protein
MYKTFPDLYVKKVESGLVSESGPDFSIKFQIRPDPDPQHYQRLISPGWIKKHLQIRQSCAISYCTQRNIFLSPVQVKNENDSVTGRTVIVFGEDLFKKTI